MLARGTTLEGWALAEQGRRAEGMAQMRQALAAYQAAGLAVSPWFLALLAEAYGHMGQADEGLSILDEALGRAHTDDERCYEAELYRLKGELLLARAAEPHAEVCFQLVLTVRPLTGGAHRIEDLPGLGPSLDGANQARVLMEGHRVRIAMDLRAMRTPLPFLGRALQAADVLTAVALVVVTVRATQAAAGSLGGAVHIIAARQECLRGAVFVAGIIGDHGDASPAPDPAVVLDHVVAGIGQLDLLGPERHGNFGTMRLEVQALMSIGRRRGGAHGQLQSQLDVDIRGLLVEVAEHAFCVWWILGIAVVADLGVEIGGDLGAAAPQLSLRALSEMGPPDAQGRKLVWGQGEPRGESLGVGRLSAVRGSILDLQERRGGLMGLALFGRRLQDFLDHLGEGAADLQPFGPGLQLSAEFVAAGFIQGELLAVLTAVGTALEPGVGGLQLAIRGEQFSVNEAEFPEEADQDGQGGFDSLRAHAAAEVAQIVLARNGRVQTGQFARAVALLLLAQIRTAAA